MPLPKWFTSSIECQHLPCIFPLHIFFFCNLSSLLQNKFFSNLCHPWLRPYTSHKLETKSKSCVFLGYFLTQSAYYCLDPSTSKIYISRHVRFVEFVFTFCNLSSPPSNPPFDSIATWIPSSLSIPTVSLVPPLTMSSTMVAQHQTPSAVSLPLKQPALLLPSTSREPSHTIAQHSSPSINPTLWP